MPKNVPPWVMAPHKDKLWVVCGYRCLHLFDGKHGAPSAPRHAQLVKSVGLVVSSLNVACLRRCRVVCSHAMLSRCLHRGCGHRPRTHGHGDRRKKIGVLQRGLYRQCQAPADFGPAIAIAAGNEHTAMAKPDRTMVGFGRADDGQCHVCPDLAAIVAN